ncbi:hypothetical protein SPRG_11972 [Saprolegnia parasitica CBS 223.65]|uniref:Uncharacterized protein n=1 Tax=Saprolegnia parasitica (strain CBS 223.65) TaxID=695850 RepID=A0A067C8K2_SAPPC|nr:hypothetical protein SPRG_11972 [Saprolegnia parasitica CBS 223.65]KDO23127.1 hypothetical protein SPRG_11972 [Saprolegnia parasitica CBS 223.65]|eukprot:XP_012206237.1 hypothetical protein SPRG_11972 [Saprolegnia parasitica CBS 223.65]
MAPRRLLDALLEDHAARLATLVHAQAPEPYAVAKLRKKLVKKSQTIPPAQRDAAVATVVNLLVQDPRITLAAKGQLVSSGTDAAAPEEALPVLHHLARQVASHPLRMSTIQRHVETAATNVQELVDALVTFGCFCQGKDAKGADAILYDEAALLRPVTDFADVSFLRSYAHASPTTESETPKKAKKAKKTEPTKPTKVEAKATRATLLDALVQNLAVRVLFLIQLELKKTGVCVGWRALIEKRLRLAAFVPTAQFAAAVASIEATVVQCGNVVVTADDKLQLAPGAVAQTKYTVPKARKPDVISKLVTRYASRTAASPLPLTTLQQELRHENVEKHDVAKAVALVLRGLERTGCFHIDRSNPKMEVVAILPSSLERPASSFEDLHFLQTPSAPAPVTMPTTTTTATATTTATTTTTKKKKKAKAVDTTDRPTAVAPSDLPALVEAYMSLFLDAVLQWVEGGNDFHVSYIRGQLQPLLPPGTDVSELVDAVVAALRQDARFVWTETKGHQRYCSGRKPSAAPSPGTLTPRANVMEPDTTLA